MFGKELAHDESYVKEYGEYKITNSYTVYEVHIEEKRKFCFLPLLRRRAWQLVARPRLLRLLLVRFA